MIFVPRHDMRLHEFSTNRVGKHLEGGKSEMDLDVNGNGGMVICLRTTSMDHFPSGKVARPSERGEMRSCCEATGLQLRGTGHCNFR
jgi:hypothetical protein